MRLRVCLGLASSRDARAIRGLEELLARETDASVRGEATKALARPRSVVH